MDRFFKKVDKTESCWNWIGGFRNKDTYGSFKINGKVVDAHRVSWQLHHNIEIPMGMVICHSCDNKKCVNPDHLFLGSYSDNSKDAVKKGIIKVPNGIRFKTGNIPYNKHFTDEQVTEIKNKISIKGKKSLKKLSEELGVKHQFLKDINCGRIYKNLK